MTATQSAEQLASAEHRRVVRELVDFGARATSRSGAHDVRIVNISPLGLMGRTSAPFQQGEKVLFELPHVRMVEAEVRWAEDGRIGIEFAKAIDADHYAMMLAFMPQRRTAW